MSGKPTALQAERSLDVVGVHGVGGTWGALATGLFASVAVNAAGADGLLAGNPAQLWKQLAAIGATIALAVPVTFGILKLVDALLGLRVTAEDEMTGLDLSQHSESAYALGGPPLGEHVLPPSRAGAVDAPAALREVRSS